MSAYWYDEWDECTYLVSVPMSYVMSKFNNDSFHNLDFGDQKDRIKDYVTANGAVKVLSFD